MNNKHCINCKYSKKAMTEKPCCDCRGRHSDYKLWKDENGGKEKMNVEKRCFNCKHSCKSMFVIPCCDCKGVETNYSKFEARIMKRSKKISIIGIKDAIDYIMWNRKELLDEIKLFWVDDTRYEMRLIMNRVTFLDICTYKNPCNRIFSRVTMTIEDIPTVFDDDMEDNIIILEVEEKEKPCVPPIRFHDDFFIGLPSRNRLNSLYGIPLDVKLKIKEVIYNPPATIIKWVDGTKTVVKCQEGEIFDKEKGFAMAFLKKALGNEGKYYDTVKKWVPMEDEQKKAPVKVTKFVSIKEYAEIAGMAESTVRHHCGDGRIKGAVKNEEGFWRIPIDVYPEGTLIEHLQGASDELTGYPI